MINLDTLPDEQLKRLEEDYKRICTADETSAAAGKKAVRKEVEKRGLAIRK